MLILHLFISRVAYSIFAASDSVLAFPAPIFLNLRGAAEDRSKSEFPVGFAL